MPYWAVSVLQWVGMVQAMQNASGKVGDTYRELVKQAVEGELMCYPFTSVKTGKTTLLSGPAAVYPVYQQFSLAMERAAKG